MGADAPDWAAGWASGVGSLPGTDPDEAARLVLGELPELPHLPELPARGPGADMLGRGTVLLADLYADIQPAGWRLTARPGVESRRARDLLSRDLDAFEEAARGHRGPVKVQAAGPWTLAAALELPRGDKVLGDAGAVRDVAAALAQGLSDHLADLGRRLPGSRFYVQLDEPSLPAVLAGHVLTASGLGGLPAPDAALATEQLAVVLGAVAAAGAVPLVHCCAPRPPVRLLVEAGARGLSLDATVLSTRDDDRLGEAVEAGVALLLGLVPSTEPAPPMPTRALIAPAQQLWARLGFPAAQLPAAVVVTPTCGLAGASPSYARGALAAARACAEALGDDPDASLREERRPQVRR